MAHSWNLEKVLNDLILSQMVQSGKNFVHVMPDELLCHAQLWRDLIIIFHVRSTHPFTTFGLWAHKLFVKWSPNHLLVVSVHTKDTSEALDSGHSMHFASSGWAAQWIIDETWDVGYVFSFIQITWLHVLMLSLFSHPSSMKYAFNGWKDWYDNVVALDV